MKLTCLSDAHLRHTNPISRSDNYAETCLSKLEQVVKHCNKVGSTLLIGGDIFERPDNPIWFVNRVIDILNRCAVAIYAIAGNHDLKYHNLENLKESSLWTLGEAVHNFALIDKCNSLILNDKVFLHAFSFGLDPSYVIRPDSYNILMLHTPIFEKEVPWFMSDAMTADQLVAKYPGFDLYCVGDIHQTCITDKVINTGSMMRSTKAQKEHRPCFVTVDTETGEKEITYFEIEQDVWKLDFEAPADESFSADLNELSEVLLARGEKLCYKDVAIELAKDNTKHQQRLMEIFDGYSERT